jgi:erythromycin esterase
MDLMLSRPATPRPSDEVLRAWLEADSIPLAGADPKASLEDLEPLKDVIGSARIVALGEATHGSAELFQLKHRMLRLLVERMGFATVAFEVGFAEALAVDAYIHGGKGSAEAVVRGLVTDAFATEENVALVEWMRRYNADARHTRKISFVGFDMTTWTSAKAATKYLADAGMRDAAAEAALATLGTLGADVRYAAAPAEVREATREAITRVVAALDGKRDVLIAKTSAPAYRIARWHARVVEQAERSYRDPTLRDALMADNVEALRADAPDARIALWLHNAHATAWPAMFEDMGRRLRRKHGKDHVVVGTAFGSGGLRALSARDVEAGPQEHRLADPPPDSFEAALALAGKPCFAIDLRRSEAAVRDWLASPIAVWSVGFAFHGREASIMRMPPALAFDAVIYIDHVTAARGLPRRGGG